MRPATFATGIRLTLMFWTHSLTNVCRMQASLHDNVKLKCYIYKYGGIMKIFRDPIHNVINLDTGDKKVNDLIISLVDSREFQRLRFIKQLGFAYFAYPSATHSRFEHSLGVAFLAKKFIEKLISIEEKVLSSINKPEHRDKLLCFFEGIRKNKGLTIVAALLHDIGHGPLSHVTEEILNFNHEEWASQIIKGSTQINKLLVKFDKHAPEIVCDILLNSKSELYPSSKLISGQIDIDKIDYLLRDSHMTGSKYGEFDFEWLLNVLTVGIKDEKVEIGLDFGKGLSIAEDFVMSRIYMFKNVYFHKIHLIAQLMLMLIFERIKELPDELINDLLPNDTLKTILFSDQQDPKLLLDDYLNITDIDLFYLLKIMQYSKDEILSNLASGILNRRLFKEVDAKHWQGIKDFINTKSGKGTDKYYMVKLDIESKKGRLTYRPGIDQIFLFEKNGTGHELLEKSHFIAQNTSIYIIPLSYYVDNDMYIKYLLELENRNNSN